MDVDDALDYLAITRLQAAYGDAVSRRAWDEIVPMFEPACRLRLDLRDGTVVERVGGDEVVALLTTSLERFDFFLFTMLNSVVDIAADGMVASGRLYMRELRRERGDGRWTSAYGLYRDSYRKLDRRWVFARRDYSSLARTAAEGDGMDVFPIE